MPRPTAIAKLQHDSTDDSADTFIRMIHAASETLQGATMLLVPTILLLDAAALSVAYGNQALAVISGCLGFGCFLVSLALIGLIQMRYIFLHIVTHKQHFYDLKSAHFQKACADLKSLRVTDAVEAVRTVHALRREIAGLDKRLVIDALMVKRRRRDLAWTVRMLAGVSIPIVLGYLVGAPGADLLRSVLPYAIVLALGIAVVMVDMWSCERIGCIYELLSPSTDVSKSFDPGPPLEEAIERLLTTVNRHYNRLNGAPGDENAA